MLRVIFDPDLVLGNTNHVAKDILQLKCFKRLSARRMILGMQ